MLAALLQAARSHIKVKASFEGVISRPQGALVVPLAEASLSDAGSQASVDLLISCPIGVAARTTPLHERRSFNHSHLRIETSAPFP